MKRNQIDGTLLGTEIDQTRVNEYSQNNILKYQQQEVIEFENYYSQWGVQYKPNAGITLPEGVSLIPLKGLQPPQSDSIYYCPSVIPLMTPAILSTYTLNPVKSDQERTHQDQERMTNENHSPENVIICSQPQQKKQKISLGSSYNGTVMLSHLEGPVLTTNFSSTVEHNLQNNNSLKNKFSSNEDFHCFRLPFQNNVSDSHTTLFPSSTHNDYLSSKNKFCKLPETHDDLCNCEHCTLPRSKLSLNQLIMLEKVFNCSKYLSSQQFSALSQTTKLPRNVLRIWFQNRRAKYHKEKKMPNFS